MMFAGPIKRGVAEATNTNDKIWSKLILNKRYRGAKSKLNSNYNRGIVDHDQGDATIKSLPSGAT